MAGRDGRSYSEDQLLAIGYSKPNLHPSIRGAAERGGNRTLLRSAIFCCETRLFFKQQFAGAIGCFHDRLDQRNAKFPFFQFEDPVDCAAGWGGNSVF
jgi:hypothetical protein